MPRVLLFAVALALTGCANMDSKGISDWLGSETEGEAGEDGQAKSADGIRQALELGSQRTTEALSREEAFRTDSEYHIPLPQELEGVAEMLRTAGYGDRVEQLERRINDGARQALGESGPVLRETIDGMSITDALAIVNGGETAATDYLRRNSSAGLRESFQPIIRKNLAENGFYRQYRGLLDVYDALPMTDKPNLDIEDYVLDKTLDAVFQRLAREEAAIRQAPLQRGSQLIQSVFGPVVL